MNKPITEMLYGLFYDVFKKSGIVLNLDQMNDLRAVTTAIANALSQEIRLELLVRVTKLQDIILEDMNKLKEQMDTYEQKVLRKLNNQIPQIIEAYKNGMTLAEIAQSYECAVATINDILKENNIPRRKRGPRRKINVNEQTD